MTILAPSNLLQLVNHFKGLQTLKRPLPTPDPGDAAMPDLRDIKARRPPSARSKWPPPAGITS
jgi:magnesium chelatase family protein